ncbi:MAG: hypothetical protein ACLTSX_01320 [Collinsella sp.]
MDDVAIFFRKLLDLVSALQARTSSGRAALLPRDAGASYQDAGFNFKVWASAERAAFIPAGHFCIVTDRTTRESSANPRRQGVLRVRRVCFHANVRRGAGAGDRALLFGILERMKFDSYMWNYDRLAPELRGDFRSPDRRRGSMGISAADRLDFGYLFESRGGDSDLQRPGVRDPIDFNEHRATFIAPGKLNTFKHYYRIGGSRPSVWRR